MRCAVEVVVMRFRCYFLCFKVEFTPKSSSSNESSKIIDDNAILYQFPSGLLLLVSTHAHNAKSASILFEHDPTLRFVQ